LEILACQVFDKYQATAKSVSVLFDNFRCYPLLRGPGGVALLPVRADNAGISDKVPKSQYVQNKFHYDVKELQNQEFIWWIHFVDGVTATN